MENANDFERFVLYRTEEALQMDSRGLEWNIQEKSELLQNQYINEILYRALNSTQPWNDFSFIDASGIKEFFYSNALACALVTFGYLSSENTTLEEIMCDPKKHEVAEKNKAIKEDAEEFRKKCQKLYEKRKVWQEEFKEKHNIKEWYIEIKEMEEKIKIEEKAVKTETDKKKIKADNNKLDEMKSYAEAIERKLANYAEIIKCPCDAFDQPAYKFLHSFKGVVQLDLLWQLHWQERKDFDFFLFHCVSPNKNRTIHADCPAKSKGERPKTLPSR